MNNKIKFLAGALALCSSAAFAQEALPPHSLDARVTFSGYVEEFGGDEIEVSGVGAELRAAFEISDALVLRGRYTFWSSDEAEFNGDSFDIDTDLTVARLGMMVQFPLESVRLYGALDYAKADQEIEGESADENGYVLSGGIRDLGDSDLIWHAEIGYADIGEVTGGAFEGSLGYRVTPALALIGGLEVYGLEDDFGTEVSIANITLGLRVLF